MHFAILVEDQSGKKMLENLIPQIFPPNNDEHTVHIHSYKGIGHIPRGLTSPIGADRRILLEQLPRLLNGFGKTFAGYGDAYTAWVSKITPLMDVAENKSPSFRYFRTCLTALATTGTIAELSP